MFDMTKNARKACADMLQAGEEIVAAAGVEPPGMFGRAIAANANAPGGVSRVTGMAAQAKGHAKANKHAEEIGANAGLAEAFPKVKGVLVLTSQRVLMCTLNKWSGKPKDLLHHQPRTDIASATYDKGKVMDKMQLTFTDGTGIAFETGRAAKLGVVAEALGAAAS